MKLHGNVWSLSMSRKTPCERPVNPNTHKSLYYSNSIWLTILILLNVNRLLKHGQTNSDYGGPRTNGPERDWAHDSQLQNYVKSVNPKRWFTILINEL